MKWKLLEILNMGSISFNKHEMDIGMMSASKQLTQVYFIFYFQLKESPPPLNIPIPTPAPAPPSPRSKVESSGPTFEP